MSQTCVGSVGCIVDHYERLGVSSTATRDEIRVAYRRLAREHHPDAKGDVSAVRMTQINEAWRVLSDPARRVVYDAQSRGSAGQRGAAGGSAGSATSAGTRTASRPVVTAHQLPATPARFPWRFMLVLAVIGIAFVLVNGALTKPGQGDVPDNLINAGSCVDLADNGDAVEVSCDGSNDGVVDSLISTDGVCPGGTEGHRDRQGMGQACVRFATANG